MKANGWASVLNDDDDLSKKKKIDNKTDENKKDLYLWKLSYIVHFNNNNDDDNPSINYIHSPFFSHVHLRG